MNLHQLFNKLIIFGFFVLIGYSLAASFVVGSVMGVVLSLVSLGAAVTFLYYLARRQYEMKSAEQEAHELGEER